MKPCVIAVEGLDTSGKGTQTKLMAKDFEDMGLKVTTRHFPMYEKPIGAFIGKCLNNAYIKDEISNEAFQSLYIADQLSFQPELKQLMVDYDIIILDRYSMSTQVYALAGAKEQHYSCLDYIYRNIIERQNGLLIPDITIVLDMNPSEIVKRKVSLDLHESDNAFMQKVSDIYRNIDSFFKTYCPALNEIIHVDASQDILTVHENIMQEVKLIWGI